MLGSPPVGVNVIDRLSLTLPVLFSFLFFLPAALTVSVAGPGPLTAWLTLAPALATDAPLPDAGELPRVRDLYLDGGRPLLLVPSDGAQGERVRGVQDGVEGVIEVRVREYRRRRALAIERTRVELVAGRPGQRRPPHDLGTAVRVHGDLIACVDGQVQRERVGAGARGHALERSGGDHRERVVLHSGEPHGSESSVRPYPCPGGRARR